MTYIRTVFLFAFLSPIANEAQIVYTDVSPDSLVGSVYELDVNNDGTAEFRIMAVTEGGIAIVKAEGITPEDSLAGYYGGFPNVAGYPFALSSETSIGISNSWVDKGILGGNHPVIMEDAKWNAGQSRYLGLRFNIAGNVHYGWARLRVESGYTAFTVREYAYNSAAGEPILSGVVGVDEVGSVFSELSIFPNPCSEILTLNFYLVSPLSVEICASDIAGKIVFVDKNENAIPGKQFFQWNISEIQSGIYFLRISADEYSVVRKVAVRK